MQYQDKKLKKKLCYKFNGGARIDVIIQEARMQNIEDKLISLKFKMLIIVTLYEHLVKISLGNVAIIW